jgi:hypothetical protein
MPPQPSIRSSSSNDTLLIRQGSSRRPSRSTTPKPTKPPAKPRKRFHFARFPRVVRRRVYELFLEDYTDRIRSMYDFQRRQKDGKEGVARSVLEFSHVCREFRLATNNILFEGRFSIWLFVVATKAQEKPQKWPLAIMPKNCNYLFGQDDTGTILNHRALSIRPR